MASWYCLFVLSPLVPRSFDMRILQKIMGAEYRKRSSCVVAWDNMALEMQAKNVRPVNGLFWGKQQVVLLRWK